MKARMTIAAIIVGALSLLGPRDAAAIGPVCGECKYVNGAWYCLSWPNNTTTWCDNHEAGYCIDGTGGCGHTY